MLRDARGERLEQARAEALRAGAVGLATGIGANLAAFGESLGPAVQRAGLDAKPAVYPVEQYMTQDGTRSA